MALKLYNTLTRKKEILRPMKKGVVSYYACGPTSYHFAHIGNLRAYIAGDLLRRYLEYLGLRVKHVMNITDVDDKTIKRSGERGISLKAFTEKYTRYFFEDIDCLNILRAHIYPRATQHIKEMTGLINRLFKKGIAYRGGDGSIYYKISKFPGYGKLSHTNIKGLKAGARVSQDEYEKGEARDFALWKAWNPEDKKVSWTPEIGGEKIKGRPGWHIECSAMSMKYLGETFDIHSGGVDLIFPHHENEIAQSEGATGKTFVKHWFHNEHLLVNGRKMSKSLGNFYTLRDLLKKDYSPKAIRYVLLATHYRQQLNFSEKALNQAREAIERLNNFVQKLRIMKAFKLKASPKIEKLIKNAERGFEKAMDDDLNIAEALAVVFDFVKNINIAISKSPIGKEDAGKTYKTMLKFDRVLGLGLKIKKSKLTDVEKVLIKMREIHRKKGNWKKADEIRNKLRKKGIILEDTEKGPEWKRAG